jgi:hypothetical protein
MIRSRAKSRARPPAPKAQRAHSPTTAAAIEHFKREKARRMAQASPQQEQLEAARREYEALLIENAARGKGGRPRKKGKAAVKDLDDVDEVADAEDEAPEE